MKCSVLIKSGNRKQYILDAIDNVMEQSRKADEIIVIAHYKDEYIEKYCAERNIKFIYEFRDTSLTDDDYTFLKIAKNEIVILLDDDDLWFPDKIKNFMELYEKLHADFIIDEPYYFSERNLDKIKIPEFKYKKLEDERTGASGISLNLNIFKKYIEEVNNSGKADDNLLEYFCKAHSNNGIVTSPQHIWYLHRHTSSQQFLNNKKYFKETLFTFKKLLTYNKLKDDKFLNEEKDRVEKEYNKSEELEIKENPSFLYIGIEGKDNGVASQTIGWKKIIKSITNYDKLYFKGFSNNDFTDKKTYSPDIVFNNFILNDVYKYYNKNNSLSIIAYADLFFMRWNNPEFDKKFIESYELNDIIVFNSELTKHNVNSYLQTHNIKVNSEQYVITCAIKDSYMNFKPDWKVERKNMCFIGRWFDSYKRIDYAFKIFREYLGRCPDAKLLIFSEKHPSENLNIPYDLKNRIEFYEGQSDEFIVNKIKDCKYSLITSQYEGFGLPIIETALLGITPIVMEDAEIPWETKQWCIVADINNINFTALANDYRITPEIREKIYKFIKINSEYKLYDLINTAIEMGKIKKTDKNTQKVYEIKKNITKNKRTVPLFSQMPRK